MIKNQILSYLLAVAAVTAAHAAENILINDFEGRDYGVWIASGDAFGTAPAAGAVSGQQVVNGFVGDGLANTFLKRDQSQGTLTSPPFTIERDYINLLIGGGSDVSSVGVKLLIDGIEVIRVTGQDDETLKPVSLPVKAYVGKQAVLVIYDVSSGGWGHINVDHIEQSHTLTRLRDPGLMPTELKLEVSNSLLLVPVGTGKPQRLTIRAGGFLVHNVDVALAANEEDVKWWGYLDLSEFVGQAIQLSYKDTENRAIGSLFAFGDQPRSLAGQPLYEEALRPQFHMSQMNGWSNDPNGMTFYDGRYHLFWQCNPLGNQWGNMYWGHASSPDMINWTEHKRALRTGGGRTPLDQRHPSMVTAKAFSGGGHVDKDNTAGWKTSDKDVIFLMVTDTGLGESIAYSVDGGKNFKFWEGNPIFTHKGRDSKPIWYQPSQHWVCAVYNEDPEIEGKEGRNITFWTSENLKDWEEQSKTYGFFECPEFFELPVDGDMENKKWTLFGATPSYLTGSFDGKAFTPDSPDKRDTIFGSVYAGQCFSNAPDGRVVYIGWARVDMGDSPFNQGFSIPLNLTLKTLPDGAVHLFANPIKEIEQLRGRPVVNISSVDLSGNQPSLEREIPGQLYDVVLTLRKEGDPKGVTLSVGDVRVHYDFTSETLNGKPVPMSGDRLVIRVLVDRPFAEVVAGDGYLYELMERPTAGSDLGQLRVSMTGGGEGSVFIETLQAYPMRSIW
jgi:fructan beta-fructosidase